MPRIPIPFIGGGGGLKRTTAFDTRLPEPFHPEPQSRRAPGEEGQGLVEVEGYGLEAASETLPQLAIDEGLAPTPGRDLEPHEAAAPWAGTADEAAIEAGDEPTKQADTAGADIEERAPWDEEPGPDQVLLGVADAESPDLTDTADRTPLEFAADVWGEDVGTSQLTDQDQTIGGEPAAEAEMAAQWEGREPEGDAARGEGGTRPTYLTPASAFEDEEGDEEVELPDFLLMLDADDDGDEEYGELETMEAPRVNDLEDVADDLLAGEHGEAMRNLMDRLRGENIDSAIARAFAAGYLAARGGEGER